MLWMLPHVNQCRTRSVRSSEKADPVTTEPRSHIVEIIHRDGRCVFRQICALLERVTHFRDVIDWIHLAQVIGRCFLPENRKTIRLSGAALIDAHHIMPAAITFARPGVESCCICGRRARAARQIKQWLRLRFLIECREHNDI